MTTNTDSKIRILEVGRIPLLKYVYPELTTWIRTGSSLVFGDEDCAAFKPNLSAFVDLVRDLRRGRFALVVLPAVHLDYHYDVSISKKLLRRTIGVAASSRLVGWVAEKLLQPSRTAIAFLDVSDSPRVSSVNYSLVPDALCYFKRELYPSVSFEGVPNPEWWRQRTEPISLPAPVQFEPVRGPKTCDVFFSGNIYTDVRRNGLHELECLARDGLKIDIGLERLSHQEYMQRMAASWLVWSPSGFGWDCYRHYEACLAGSVPVIDLPPNQRVLPLKNGEHCFYYRPISNELKETIKSRLGDKRRLLEIARQAREHVVRNYSRPALVRYVLDRVNQKLSAAGRATIVPQSSCSGAMIGPDSTS